MKNVEKTENLSCDQLRELLDYDPETGKLYWKVRDIRWFKSGDYSDMDRWNTRYSGEEALATVDKDGYLYGSIMKVKVKAHRVIWCIMTGKWPSGVIDHINHRCNDNRWSNLRDTSIKDNGRNRGATQSESGVAGVSRYRKDNNRWQVRISDGKKTIWLGIYDTLEEAIEVRRRAERDYGYFVKEV